MHATMKKKFTTYEGETVTLGRKLLRETKGDYIAVDLFQYICYWVLKNEQDEVNFHDDRYWTHFTIKDIMKLPDYDYLKEWEIKRGLRCLYELKLVERGNYNTTTFDHTAWYSVSKKTIEYYQPNLIRLFDKKKTQNTQSKSLPPKVEISTIESRDTNQRRANSQPPKVEMSTDSIYTIDNNHCNNQTPNQEKETFFLKDQHQQVDKVGDKVDDESRKSDSKNQYPFSAKEWTKWKFLLPSIPYYKGDIEKLKEMVDEYGEELVESNIKYFDDGYHCETMARFLDSVEGGVISDRREALEKEQAKYRLRW